MNLMAMTLNSGSYGGEDSMRLELKELHKNRLENLDLQRLHRRRESFLQQLFLASSLLGVVRVERMSRE